MLVCTMLVAHESAAPGSLPNPVNTVAYCAALISSVYSDCVFENSPDECQLSLFLKVYREGCWH